MRISLTDPTIYFIAAGIGWAIELIPQIIKTVKRKKVEDISLPFYGICLMSYTVYFIGAHLQRNYILILSHIPSFILLIIMLGLILNYRRK